MWIPTPIYERIPQFWFLLGLLFITAGLYLGFEFVLSFYYAGLGALCCVYGGAIAMLRFRHRQDSQTNQQAPAAE